MKATDIFSPYKRFSSDRDASPLQVTFDPQTPQSTRVHLIPLKTGWLKRNPSIVLINGWHMFLIGPSWADLLRAFIEALDHNDKAGIKHSLKEMEEIRLGVVEKMHDLYPGVPENILHQDLNEVVGLCIAVAHGGEVPAEIQADVSLTELSRHMKAPQRMDLLVSPMIEGGTWDCPLHCKGCYATHQAAMVIDKALSTQEWKTIIDTCREAGIPQLTFTGGEPTQRTDLVELIDYAQWHVTRLNTSGLNLTSSFCKELFDANLDGLQVTLYSQDAKIHENLVGSKGAWEKTVQGIKNAVAAGLSVSVNTPLVKLNSDYAATLKFIHSLGVIYATCSGLIPTGAAPSQIKEGAALTNAELMEVMRTAVKEARKLKVDLAFTSPGWLTGEQIKELGLTNPICGACLTNMAVMPNGAVTACQSWLDDPAGLGNLLTTPWKTIWDNQRCKKMRRTDQDGCPLNETLAQEVRQ